jgi:hypothetical protein
MSDAAKSLGRADAARTVIETLLASDESQVVIAGARRRKMRKEFD